MLKIDIGEPTGDAESMSDEELDKSLAGIDIGSLDAAADKEMDEYISRLGKEMGLDEASDKHQAEGPPERYAATEQPMINIVAYRGEHESPLTIPLADAAAMTRFLAWCRTQDQAEDVQQFSIDSSTNPVGGKEDVERFAAQLGEALSRVANEGIGPEVRQIGDAILVASAGAEGLVLTEESPVRNAADPGKDTFLKRAERTTIT